tara:strand:+ start:925 stop:1491 length:567 start_codon:yes stop_codon:yes gene_type:complete
MDRYVRDYWYDHDGCDKIIDMFKVAHEKGHTVPGKVGGGDASDVKEDRKKSTEISFEDVWNGVLGEDVWGLHDYMDWITECYTDYWNHFGLPGDIGIRVLPQVQYYKPNEGFFFPHIDAEAEVMTRQLVYITYLNDVPDGGTILVNNDMTITAKKGKTVIFPAGITHKHVGQISKKHHKYICTGWVEW